MCCKAVYPGLVGHTSQFLGITNTRTHAETSASLFTPFSRPYTLFFPPLALLLLLLPLLAHIR